MNKPGEKFEKSNMSKSIEYEQLSTSEAVGKKCCACGFLSLHNSILRKTWITAVPCKGFLFSFVFSGRLGQWANDRGKSLEIFSHTNAFFALFIFLVHIVRAHPTGVLILIFISAHKSSGCGPDSRRESLTFLFYSFGYFQPREYDLYGRHYTAMVSK
jgi:hypothetical protein